MNKGIVIHVAGGIPPSASLMKMLDDHFTVVGEAPPTVRIERIEPPDFNFVVPEIKRYRPWLRRKKGRK